MSEMINLLAVPFLGNTLQAYLVALVVFLGAVLALRILKSAVFSRLKTWAALTPSLLDDLILDLCQKAVLPLLYLGAFYLAAKQLRLNPGLDQMIHAVWLLALIFQTTRVILAVLLYGIQAIWFKRETPGGGTPISKSILTLTKFLVWAVAAVFMLDNMGLNVSAIVAGLGIGGVAVALAAQTILGDLFNYFVIFFDKPFEEGDFVIVDDYMGEIEHIGIKSTRIRSLGGEQIVISNSNLTSSRIRNYKRMQQRRVLFTLGVIYDTTLDQLKKIPVLLRQIIENAGSTRFDRAHFKAYGSYSLDFEIVYYVLAADYNVYAEVQQKINLQIKETFEKEKIEFAYPTQVELQKQLD